MVGRVERRKMRCHRFCFLRCVFYRWNVFSYTFDNVFLALLALLLENTIVPSILWFLPPILQEVPTIFLLAILNETIVNCGLLGAGCSFSATLNWIGGGNLGGKKSIREVKDSRWRGRVEDKRYRTTGWKKRGGGQDFRFETVADDVSIGQYSLKVLDRALFAWNILMKQLPALIVSLSEISVIRSALFYAATAGR